MIAPVLNYKMPSALAELQELIKKVMMSGGNGGSSGGGSTSSCPNFYGGCQCGSSGNFSRSCGCGTVGGYVSCGGVIKNSKASSIINIL